MFDKHNDFGLLSWENHLDGIILEDCCWLVVSFFFYPAAIFFEQQIWLWGSTKQLNIDELYTGGFQAEEQGRLAILRGSLDVSLNQ
jgi:hypothetical protein